MRSGPLQQLNRLVQISDDLEVRRTAIRAQRSQVALD